MSRSLSFFALAVALIVLGSAASAASDAAVDPELSVAGGSAAPAIDDPDAALCVEDLEVSFAELGAVPMHGHKGDPGDPIVCNEQCDSFEDDCSHICGDDSGLCFPLSLPSGLCFFCLC